MRIINDTFIIGIDSGYGNIKTANCCFPASVATYDTEPVFKDNMLVYGNRFYLIGEAIRSSLQTRQGTMTTMSWHLPRLQGR